MKRPPPTALYVATVVLACASFAAETHAAPSEAEAFVKQVREAAARPGGQAIADLTQFPFLFDSQPLQREAFIAKAAPALFTPRVRQCLQRAEPQAEDGRLVLWCKPYGFYLGPVRGRWRLIEFTADGE
ncbi:hypothetical protein LRS03_19050 [Rhizobacter sp. J219]|jgi:hypothetical protein|uniref:hypothetical protein n=1 Tax=Rhizobacter sp. J219 TaxID=2898430 RepID=UPI0021510E5F|nr:hypothetical protein [Rhizobacter sp. J219]MCR5884839.1 hypothetical protein [Rhizobacter sp. J219]